MAAVQEMLDVGAQEVRDGAYLAGAPMLLALDALCESIPDARFVTNDDTLSRLREPFT